MHIEFKNLCNASKHMNMHKSNANKQGSWACSPYLCASLLSKNFDPSSFLLMLLPCPCPSLISPPWNIYFVVQLIPWSYLCSNFSPFVINFHKRYVIPIKSLDINWKSVNLIVTKECIGIDGWGLILHFWWTSPYVLEWHYLNCSWDTTWDLWPSYQSVGHLPPFTCQSCWWGNLLRLMIT